VSLEYQFEWEDAKACANARKHGVSLEEAQTVFEDLWALAFGDRFRSDREERFIIIGMSRRERTLTCQLPSRLPDDPLDQRPTRYEYRENCL